jgi:serine/threonine protein kinase
MIDDAWKRTISAARSGDAAAIDELGRRARRAFAEHTAKHPLSSLVADDEVVAFAIRHLGEFKGETEPEWTQWLLQLRQDRTSHLNSDHPERRLPEVDVDDRTLHKGDDLTTRFRPASVDYLGGDFASPSVVPDSDQTLVKPGDSATFPDSSDQTLQKRRDIGDQTLRKPPARAHDATQTLQVADIHQAAALAATGSAGRLAPDDPAIGKKFGDYKLLSVIARGGMGVVYKAQQRKLNRICAVKMILAGQFADQMDVDRFYAEAEAAANLRHPNIVGIYEIGEAEGQHFFSMEYIEGQSLNALARENPLPPERAAEYTKTIAEAMQFAHERGILHRDLKPSNVLLDGKDQPLITDFGLAKRVEGGSQLTMTGMVVGTPSYMPPEQARGDTDNIGTAADIYSTGAILYELLTGLPPFRGSTPYETIRRVLEAEPTSPRVLNPSVPRDLETICLKTLQKDPAFRYASEQDLADELGRFLAGEPILARPISPFNRAWRWCRRNPVVASLSVAALTFLIVALVASTVGYIKTSAALKESDESFRQARAAVDELFTSVSEDTLLNQPGMQPLRKDLLRRALNYYEKFLEQRGDDVTVRDEMAGTFFRVGLITEVLESPRDALPWYDKAFAFQSEQLQHAPNDPLALKSLGDIWNAIGRVHHNSGESSLALKAYTKGADIREQLVEMQPGESESLRLWTNSLMNLAIIEREQGNTEAARAIMEKAQTRREQQLAGGDSDVKLRRDYAKGFYNLGVLETAAANLQSAESSFGKARDEFIRLLEDEPQDLDNQLNLATCHRLIADIRSSLLGTAAAEDVAEKLKLALDSYQEAEKLLKRLSLRNPDVLEYGTALAGVEMNLAGLYQSAQNPAGSRQAFEAALVILESLAKDHPGVPRIHRDLAVVRKELAVLQAMEGKLEAALVMAAAARTSLAQLAKDHPENEGDYSPQLLHAAQIIEWIQQIQQDSPPP